MHISEVFACTIKIILQQIVLVFLTRVLQLGDVLFQSLVVTGNGFMPLVLFCKRFSFQREVFTFII